MFHLKAGVSNALWSLQSYLYSAEEKILPAEQAWPTPHRQCKIYHVTDLCVCHARGAGPDPSKWFIQDPTVTRELPAKLEELLWCKGCSWKLLIIKTWLGQSLLHRFQTSTVWTLMFPNTWGCQIAGYPRMFSSCSTLHTLLTASLFLRDSCDPTASPNWDKQTQWALQRVRMAWFLSQLWSRTVSSSQEPAPGGTQDPTETWNKHITSVAALDSGDTAV